MLYKLFYLSSFILLVDLVNSRQYVSLSAPSTIRFKTDKLPLTCTAQGATTSNSISSIALQKKKFNGQFAEVVKIFSFNNQNKTLWTDSTMQSVATVLKEYVSPSSTAGLQIEVAANNVKCTFSGEYRCEIKAITINGNALDGFSNTVNISMTVSPISINDITRSPAQYENIYNETTVVTLSCSGDVGNPASNLRWCIFRNGKDSGFIGYSNSADITQDTASFNQDGCQYRRTSRLTYNVSASYNYADFRCETGGTTTTCGHTSAIAANITIKKYTEPTTGDQEGQGTEPTSGDQEGQDTESNTGGRGGPGTSSAGAIAGGVIGAFVVIVLIIVIVYFLAFRKKNAGDSYRANGENGVYDDATNNRPDNHVYSTMNSPTGDNAQDDDSYYNL